MLTRERLAEALQSFPSVVSVDVVGQPLFIATVVSSSFENQNEAVRQAAVWRHLRKQLSEHELPQIEFIFTDTPAERATG